MTFSLLWFFIGIAIAAYICIGVKTACQFFWCLGTSHGGNRPKWYLPMEIGYLVGMILVWPLFWLWLGMSEREPKHIKEHNGPIYANRHLPNLHYACYGLADSTDDGDPLVVFQNIKTKKLYYCTETYFENNMKLISK